MEKKVALVTGGLSGMGKASALELAEHGYDVVIFDIQDDKAEAVLAACRAFGSNAAYKKCNLLNTKEIDNAFQFIEESYGHLDCALNNAGTGILSKPFAETPEAEIDKLWELDVKAYMMCMIHELHMMEKQGFGRIVNTASGSGVMPVKGMALYSACKHAVCGLTKAAALDYATKNITINAIAPGTIETELVLYYKEHNPEDYKAWCKSNPAERLGNPNEIARVVRFLFEEESSFINGVVLPIDSGCVAGTWKE